MRVAVAQTPGVRLEQWRETLTLIDDLIRQAAGLRAELVVLPECAWPAYCLGSRSAYDDARAAGLPEPDTFLQHVQQAARDQRVAVCIGHIAEHAGRLYNAATLIDADGRLLGTRHKCFLWAFDHDYFQPGEQIAPVDTPWGRVGVMICADARLPEIPATLAARGAELIVQPTAWVNAGPPTDPWNPQPDFLIAARAVEFGVPIASASKWGIEGDTAFVGGSLICDAAGHVLAQCGQAETAVIAADIAPARALRPVVTAPERATLLTASQLQPPRRHVGPLEVVLCPAGKDASGNSPRIQSSDAHPRLVIQPNSAGDLEHTPSCADDRVTFLTGPTPEVLDFAGVRIGAIAAIDAVRFAPLRCVALRGVHLVVVFGADAPLGVLRTRACENRIWLLQMDNQGWRAVAPTGDLFARSASPPWQRPAVVLLDPAAAASKLVAPHTDVLVDRRPQQYEF